MSEISKFITIIRPEFMAFCEDACKAATLNHLLFRIAYKCKDQPKEQVQAGNILWYGSNEQITGEMSNAWGLCKVRKETNELVKMNLLGRRSNPTWGADRTKHFCFGTEQCGVFLDLLEKHEICFVHLDLPSEVKHLIYSSNANDRSIKCSCEKGENEGAFDKSIECNSSIYQMHSINVSLANDKSIEAITKNTTKNNNKDNDKEESAYKGNVSDEHLEATASTRTLVSHPEHDFIWFDDLMVPSLIVVKLTQSFPGPYFSEMEDKRRERVASDIINYLKNKGIDLKVKWEHDTVETTIDSDSHQTAPDYVQGEINDNPRSTTERYHHSSGNPHNTPVHPGNQEATTTERHTNASTEGTRPHVRDAQASGQVAKPEEAPTTRTRRTRKPAAPVIELTPKGEKVIAAWAALFKSPPDVGPKTIEAANELYDRVLPWCHEFQWTCKQTLDDIRKWCFASDPEYYRKHGVDLCTVNRQFERWQSIKQNELEQAQKKNPIKSGISKIQEEIAASRAAMAAVLEQERARYAI